ncbi:MAG: MmcQ/YjbR family DNA-binding protein [Candidatus Dormiibacterota bacterium]
MITTDDIRRWATALPEVEEITHFRFGVPIFRVRGKTFAGLGRDGSTAVFCVTERQARSAAADDPASCETVRRMDARRSFLGLQVQLSRVPEARIRGLVEDAWRRQAPKRLVDEYDRGTTSPAR